MKRIAWIDNFKFFCIFAVMAEHVPMLTGITHYMNFGFCVSGFFFISGYLYKHRPGFWAFFKKKVVQLLIPWLLFSVLVILSSRVVSFGSHDGSLWTDLLNNFIQKRFHGDEMWFVAALFVCFIPLYFLIGWVEKDKAAEKKKIICSLPVIFVLSVFNYFLAETNVIGGTWHQYPWHLEYIFRGLLLMFLGYLFRRYGEEKLDKINTRSFRIIMVFIYLAMIWGTQLAHHVFNPYDDTAFRYVSTVIAIPTLVAISKVMPSIRLISFMGRNTLTYYGLHGKVESLIHYVLYTYVREPYWGLCWSFTDSIGLLLAATFSCYIFSAVVSIILIIPAYLIEKYLPFAVGKGFTKKIK